MLKYRIYRIRNSFFNNNNSFKNNKEKIGSRTSGDRGKKDNLKTFKCFYTNATSLNNKLSYLEILLAIEENSFIPKLGLKKIVVQVLRIMPYKERLDLV